VLTAALPHVMENFDFILSHRGQPVSLNILVLQFSQFHELFVFHADDRWCLMESFLSNDSISSAKCEFSQNLPDYSGKK